MQRSTFELLLTRAPGTHRPPRPTQTAAPLAAAEAASPVDGCCGWIPISVPGPWPPVLDSGGGRVFFLSLIPDTTNIRSFH